MRRARFGVVEVRSGRIRSRHETEVGAWRAIDRIERRLTAMTQASPHQHGGLGQIIELAVCRV